MNLEELEQSRRFPREGDVFAMLPPDGLFLFGRVIRKLDAGTWKGALLLYVYSARSEGLSPIPDLEASSFLIPPVITNRQGWLRGYFKHVEARPLAMEDRSVQHRFKRWSEAADSSPIYCDEYGQDASAPFEPVGLFVLDSYRTIDDAVSLALGIPVAPD